MAFRSSPFKSRTHGQVERTHGQRESRTHGQRESRTHGGRGVPALQRTRCFGGW